MEMKPEPIVNFEGQVSDGSEHEPMLASKEGNRLADQMALDLAKELGFTEEEQRLFFSVRDE